MSDVFDPIFVELAGLPASGKTTTASLLKNRLLESNLRCTVVPEAAARSPLAHLKKNWKFNAWTLCQAVGSVLEHHGTSDDVVVVLDRGLVDALCWIKWFRSKNEIDEAIASALESFAKVPAWFRHSNVTVVLRAAFETALHRRGSRGRILNEQTFSELRQAYETSVADLQRDLRLGVLVLDTDDLSPAQVLDRVTEFLAKCRPDLAISIDGRLTRR